MVMATKRYHAELGFPKGVKLPEGLGVMRWTSHAIQASKNDRYGNIPASSTIDFATARLIEVDMEGGKVVKYLTRTPLPGTKLDVVHALKVLPDGAYLVKTVWLNERNDAHQTLDTSRYNRVG